ncbi:MAG: FeoB small GTPase domain-containing protein, partial [Coriobacteriales bacterium]|nr:FeoB small GTPase domain-containing protein [Coriobacteriales bacterium]
MNTRIALLGQPNSGKSTVFNALTGSRQHVGNWPGKTVEKNDGFYTYQNERFVVTDLPGSYGLSGNSDEEIITADYIRSGQADLVCILVDASQLERSMYMVAEFAPLGAPAVLLLNMMDVALAQNKQINHELLQQRLGIPVLPFTAAEPGGYEDLKALLARELKTPHRLKSAPQAGEDATSTEAVLSQGKAKYQWVADMLEGVTRTSSPNYHLTKLDRILTSPIKGKLMCVAIVLAAFIVAMLVMMPFMSIGSMIPALLREPVAGLMNGWGVNPWLVSVFSILIPTVIYFCISMASFVFGVNLVFGFLEEV